LSSPQIKTPIPAEAERDRGLAFCHSFPFPPPELSGSGSRGLSDSGNSQAYASPRDTPNYIPMPGKMSITMICSINGGNELLIEKRRMV
jgi:hypothetical protein